MGYGTHGELGLGDSITVVTTPTLIGALSHEEIVQVAGSGSQHRHGDYNLFLTRNCCMKR